MRKLVLSLVIGVTIVLSSYSLVILTGQIIRIEAAQGNATGITAPTAINRNSTSINFLTYGNSSYGIKIGYPSYWIKEGSRNPGSHDIVKFRSPPGTLPIELRISGGQAIPKNMSLDKWSSVTINGLSKSFRNFSLVGSNSTTIAGIPAHEIVYTASLPSSGILIKTIQLLSIKDGKELVITANSLSRDFPFYEPTLMKMINSFAFVPKV